MSFCSKCGSEQPGSTQFCPSCGAPVSAGLDFSSPPSSRSFAPDFSKISAVDWVRGGNAAVVFLCCFLPFYSFTGVFSFSLSAPTIAAFMWLTFFTGLAGVLEIFLAASLTPPMFNRSQRALVQILVSGISALLVLIFFVVHSPFDGWGLSIAGVLDPIACGVWLGFSIKEWREVNSRR